MCKDGTCEHDHSTMNTNKMAASATLHCLVGCAIGEVLGMILGVSFGISTFQTVIISTLLAFIFGFTLSVLPLLKAGMKLSKAMPVVLTADTLSITTMEIVDNSVIAAIPGALHAGLVSPLFWLTMPLSLMVAFIAAYPVNKILIARGKGHALVMEHHGPHSH